MRDHANGEPHEGEDRAHPARVAACEVVVHGDHVHAAATNGVDGGTERTNERFPFAGAHLRDLSLMEHDGPEDLLVVRAHAGGAARRFARSRKNFGQLVVECSLQRFAFEGAQHSGDRINARTNLTVARRLHLVGARVDGVKDRLEAAEFAVV